MELKTKRLNDGEKSILTFSVRENINLHIIFSINNYGPIEQLKRYFLKEWNIKLEFNPEKREIELHVDNSLLNKHDWQIEQFDAEMADFFSCYDTNFYLQRFDRSSLKGLINKLTDLTLENKHLFSLKMQLLNKSTFVFVAFRNTLNSLLALPENAEILSELKSKTHANRPKI
jgi:hypothetical protein